MSKEKPSRFKQILQAPKNGWHATQRAVSRGRVGWRNFRRRNKHIDYIYISLRGSLPERNEAPRGFIERRLPLPPPALSLQTINSRIQQIIDADNVRGVIFSLEGLSIGLATLESLRQSFGRLKNAGKTVVVYTPYVSNGSYYLATAADKIIVPPSTNFDALGLYSEATFLKDALAHWGLKFTNLQISPYKTAYNNFSESDVTPQQAEQINWLLDDRYDLMTSEMAQGRGLTQDEIKALIDTAPHTAAEMVQHNLIDHVAYQDQIAELLYNPNWEAERKDSQKKSIWSRLQRNKKSKEETAEADEPAEKEPQVAKIAQWPQARKQLRGKYREPVRGKKIGVISLEGAIMMGESQSTPFGIPLPIIGAQTAGERTITQQVRQAEKDDTIAALVLHVDSPGGLALAADLMNRDLQRWREKKPFVVYMSNAAASGGYYVSTFAHHIVAQPSTVTGSIGVIAGTFSTQELYDKLLIGRASFKRGANADLYTSGDNMTEERFNKLMAGIKHSYHQFKTVVATGRQLPYDQLDEICLGRVWTGRQALQHKLVDSHGDLIDAIHKAAELAELPTDDTRQIQVENIELEGKGYQLPKPFTQEAGEILTDFKVEFLEQLQGDLYLMPFGWRTRN